MGLYAIPQGHSAPNAGEAMTTFGLGSLASGLAEGFKFGSELGLKGRAMDNEAEYRNAMLGQRGEINTAREGELAARTALEQAKAAAGGFKPAGTHSGAPIDYEKRTAEFTKNNPWAHILKMKSPGTLAELVRQSAAGGPEYPAALNNARAMAEKMAAEQAALDSQQPQQPGIIAGAMNAVGGMFGGEKKKSALSNYIP